MAALTDEEIAAALRPQDPATKDFIMQQTMLRVKDPKKSLAFYSQVLGMTLLCKIHVAPMKFTVYFMGYEDVLKIPSDEKERQAWALSRPATIELTHNWGSETDEAVKYHNGNSEPRGFGHIGIAVPDVYAAADRFKAMGVEFVKEPDGGSMKGLAFIKDPDGYWIEILNPNKLATFPTTQ